MNNVIQLFTDGDLRMKDGREFTRLVGGFNANSEVMTTKQIASFMDLDNRVVNQTITRNIKSFEENVDIIDLKSAITEGDSALFTIDDIGYTKNAYNASKNIYILSESGVLLYLKFAQGDKAVELYKDFLEDYFRTKAENKVMKKSIQEELEFWNNKKATALGKSIMAKTVEDKMKALEDSEEASNQIVKLEKSISEQETYNMYKEQIDIAEQLTNSKNSYDIGTIAKALKIENMGRNNLFKWLKDNKILTSKNEPYQQYMKHFKVILTTNQNGYTNSKSLLKPEGIDFLIKRLKKDGKLITKTTQEVFEELENQETV